MNLESRGFVNFSVQELALLRVSARFDEREFSFDYDTDGVISTEVLERLSKVHSLKVVYQYEDSSNGILGMIALNDGRIELDEERSYNERITPKFEFNGVLKAGGKVKILLLASYYKDIYDFRVPLNKDNGFVSLSCAISESWVNESVASTRESLALALMKVGGFNKVKANGVCSSNNFDVEALSFIDKNKKTILPLVEESYLEWKHKKQVPKQKRAITMKGL